MRMRSHSAAASHAEVFGSRDQNQLYTGVNLARLLCYCGVFVAEKTERKKLSRLGTTLNSCMHRSRVATRSITCRSCVSHSQGSTLYLS